MSLGNSEKPDGTSTRRASCAGPIAAFARYMRIDEPIVPVSQYIVTFVRISSFVKHRSTSPSQSLHARARRGNEAAAQAPPPAPASQSPAPNTRRAHAGRRRRYQATIRRPLARPASVSRAAAREDPQALQGPSFSKQLQTNRGVRHAPMLRANPSPPRLLRWTRGVVVAESLTRRFGSLLAVDDLSFALQPGTITGFLGPNGAGETTTLRMLLGLATPTSGRALVFDRTYGELAHPALRIGAVLEATDFHPGRARASARSSVTRSAPSSRCSPGDSSSTTSSSALFPQSAASHRRGRRTR